MPDSEGRERVTLYSPYIRVAGRHQSGDIWVSMESEARWDMTVDTIDQWLPKLSSQLRYIPRTYPVIVHGVPTMSVPPHIDEESGDLTALFCEQNTDIITCPAALKQAAFLARGCGPVPCKSHGSAILYFMDHEMANKSIDWHIALGGRLLPTTKFVLPPLQCYNCQHMGHPARYCKTATRCGRCAGNHDTRHCQSTNEDSPPDQPAPLKCTRCQGSHAASDNNCTAHAAAILSHWHRIAEEGPHFLA